MTAALIDLFKNLKLQYSSHQHATIENNKEWAETFKKSVQSSHGDVSCVKSFLLKPKGGSDPKSVLVIALDTTETPINPLVKSLGFKEARAATDDLVLDLLKVQKADVSPFSLSNVTDKESLVVAVDELIIKQKVVAIRGSEKDLTFSMSASTLLDYVNSLGIQVKTVDFSNLAVPASETLKKAAPNSQSKEKIDDQASKIGIEVKKDSDFATWYTQVLTRTEMLDYYDISGCYIIRPWAFKIWKFIQNFFGSEIEKLGVEDCYFPMFVSARALNREKDHVEGFAPEVAWVTKAGQSDLAEPIAVRPTSETVMYPAYAQWIRSHRDLPLRLNQWCNVVRWEFKHPQPFLRTREFLWQEGHTAFATKQEADTEVRQILDLYRRVYEDLLAVPVVPGKKSEKEKFAGGLYTTTVEGFIPTTGRAIQGATSHCLGTNFSKMFDIMIENEQRERVNVWQNSWGLTTRTIGVMVMVHGDDKGLVLPPRVAAIQVVVIPVGLTSKASDDEKASINGKAIEIEKLLLDAGIRAKVDLRENYTVGYKYNHWEMKGVPVRLEVGPKDIAKNQARCVLRMNGESMQLELNNIGATVVELLEQVQHRMFEKAKKERDSRLVRLETWDKFVSTLDQRNLVLAPWCEAVKCEESVKERSAKTSLEDQPADEKAPSMGAKTLCIPFNQPTENPLKPGVTKCFACGENAQSYTLWGRSY